MKPLPSRFKETILYCPQNCHSIRCISNAPAHVVAVSNVSCTGLPVPPPPRVRFLQSQQTSFSAEILRLVGRVGGWHTFPFAFPLFFFALLSSRWRRWRWSGVHFGITAQLQGAVQEPALLTKRMANLLKSSTDEWLQKEAYRRVPLENKHGGPETRAKQESLSTRTCVCSVLRRKVCTRQMENWGFSRWHPIHEASDCDFAINTGATCSALALSGDLFFFLRLSPLAAINKNVLYKTSVVPSYAAVSVSASSDCWSTRGEMWRCCFFSFLPHLETLAKISIICSRRGALQAVCAVLPQCNSNCQMWRNTIQPY